MNKTKSQSKGSFWLRNRAAKFLNINPEVSRESQLKDVRNLLEELHLQQIEMEKQSEEMRLAQLELEAARYELKRSVEEPTLEIIRTNERLTSEIEKLKQEESALRKSEGRYRHITETITNYIYTVPIKMGQPEETIHGPGCEAITGYTAEEFKANPQLWIQMVHEEDRGAVDEHTSRILSWKKVDPLEYRIIRKDGTQCWVRNTPAQHFNGNGRLLSYDGLIQDISERKRLEDQLQQSKKMEAIGTLAGGIAHDFNNLLMGIKGNITLMLMDTDPSQTHYERLKRIEKQILNGADLTSHLLGFARKGRYEIVPVDLNQLIGDTTYTFGRELKNITIHRKLSRDLFMIEADPGQIEHVLLNLLTNAADAISGSGDIFLKTANTSHKSLKGMMYDPKPGNYVLLTITDTGVGMDKETQEHIFEPFFTTKEMGLGTGLGLASTYGIMKAHGGYIEVVSKKGHGSTIKIYLPASENKIGKSVKASEHFIEGTRTILLTDDEEEVREVGRELLEIMGYRVITAKNGKEAIKFYKKNLDKIDIVVLDMIMPKKGGGEAYDRLKEINPDVKVLLVSGYSIEGKAKEILDRGCNGFIQKPYSVKKLSQKIREILNET